MISSGPLTTACKLETLYAKLANMNHQQKLRLAEAWVDIVYVLKLIYFYTNVKFRIFCPLLIFLHVCFHKSKHWIYTEAWIFLPELFTGIMLPRSYLFGSNPSIQYFVSSKNLLPVFEMIDGLGALNVSYFFVMKPNEWKLSKIWRLCKIFHSHIKKPQNNLL